MKKDLRLDERESFFFLCTEIVVNETLTKKIEGIEDAIGNEVYYLSLKTDRKQIDRQNDLNEQRV